MTEEPHQIPPTWVWSNVDTLYDVIGGGTPSTKIEKYWKGDVPWITSADINDVKKITPRKFITKEAIQNSATKLVPEYSIIVVTRVGLGKVALTEYPLCFSQDSQALVGDNSIINPNYSVYYLSTAVQEFKYKHRGTTIAGVPRKQLKQLPFPLPPYNEQVRIVGRVEELFSRLDAGVRGLQTAQTQLEHYRQTTLKQAYTGNLFRKIIDKDIFDSEKENNLLNKALKEKRKNWEKEQIIKFVQKNKFPKNDIWKKKYKEPIYRKNTNLPQLPNEWSWVSIDQISYLVTDGDHNPPKRVEKGMPHLTAKHIQNYSISEKECTYISQEDFKKVRKRYDPQENDLIITCVGSIGRTAIVPKNYIFSADRNLAAVRLVSDVIHPKFLMYYLNTLFAQRLIHGASGSTAQPHFYLAEIRAFPVVLAPYSDQKRIIDEIERRFSILKVSETIINKNKRRADRLRQSILASAFNGSLVPQDLHDEPARVLLERIKAQRIKQRKLM